MAGYGYGQRQQSVWGALGQGWQMGYLLGLQRKARREDQEREAAGQLRSKEMEHGWKQQEREQTLLDDILKVGGNPAVEAVRNNEYGGSKLLDQRLDERKGGLAHYQRTLTEEGPDAASGLYGILSQGNPSMYSPMPEPGESEIGEIGHRYKEPIPGQSMERPAFVGTKQMDSDRKAAEDVRKREYERTQLAEDAEANPELNPILAEMFNMVPENIGTLRKVMPTKDLLATGRLSQGDRRGDQADDRLDLATKLQALRELIEAGGTKKSEAAIANTQAGTEFKQEQTKTERGASLRGAREIEGLGLKNTNVQKHTEQIGKPGAGKAPTERDQDVEAYTRHFAGMSDDEIEDQIDSAPAGMQGKMRQAKQAIFDKRRREIIEGAGGGAPTGAPVAAPRIAVNPKTKQRLINRNDGKGWVPANGQ